MWEVKRVARSDEVVELVLLLLDVLEEVVEEEGSAETDETEGPPTVGWCGVMRREFSEAGCDDGRG